MDLRRLAETLVAGEPLPPDTGRWLGGVLLAAADDETFALARALGLDGASRRAALLQHRDGLIRELAGTWTGSTRAVALNVQGELRRYGSVCWPRERNLPSLPDTASERRRLCYQVFRADPSPPTSYRQLYDIVSMCDFVAVETAHCPADTALDEHENEGSP